MTQRRKPKRPTVRLDLAYREIAKKANSRVLREPCRATLDAAASGQPTDLLDLNAALMNAMASTATRAGQSSARRVLQDKIWPLCDFVQARLSAAFDGEPDEVEVLVEPKDKPLPELEEWLAG